MFAPDDLTGAVHAHHGLIATDLEHHRPFVVTDRHRIRSLQATDRPNPLQSIVERVLQAIRILMPDAQRPVLAPGDDHGKFGVEAHRRNVVRVTFERLNARFRLVIPNLSQLIVSAGDEVRAIAAGEVVDAVDPFFVTLERKIAHRRRHVPHLDGAIERGAGERVRILRVEHHVHHVVRVSLEHHRAVPLPFPIPKLDEHIIRARHHVRLRRMHRDRPYVIAVRLEPDHQLRRVIIIHPQEHVVRPRRDPLLARDPLRRPHRQFRHLERLHQRVRLVIPYRHVPRVQIRQYPRFRGVYLHPLHPVAPLHELALDVQPHRHRRSPSRPASVARVRAFARSRLRAFARSAFARRSRASRSASVASRPRARESIRSIRARRKKPSRGERRKTPSYGEDQRASRNPKGRARGATHADAPRRAPTRDEGRGTSGRRRCARRRARERESRTRTR